MPEMQVGTLVPPEDRGREVTTHAELRRLDKNFDMKVRAKEAVVRLLRNGTLVRPTTCPKCESQANIEAHHPDYNKPTEIVWLCHKCHMNEHPKCMSLRSDKEPRYRSIVGSKMRKEIKLINGGYE